MKNINEKLWLKGLGLAIKAAGSQAKLAKLLGVNASYITNWIKRNKKIPAARVITIEKLLDGKVTRYEMRPDIYPPE